MGITQTLLVSFTFEDNYIWVQVTLDLETDVEGYMYIYICYKSKFQEPIDLSQLKQEIESIPYFTWAGALTALVLGTFLTLFDMDNRV